MRRRRGVDDPRLLCAGPGRLCQALGVTGALDGLALDRAPFAFAPTEREFDIVTSPRIGLTKAVDRQWRFAARSSRFLSRPAGA
jgi:DNA-3-methyladenine glycosylase